MTSSRVQPHWPSPEGRANAGTGIPARAADNARVLCLGCARSRRTPETRCDFAPFPLPLSPSRSSPRWPAAAASPSRPRTRHRAPPRSRRPSPLQAACASGSSRRTRRSRWAAPAPSRCATPSRGRCCSRATPRRTRVTLGSVLVSTSSRRLQVMCTSSTATRDARLGRGNGCGLRGVLGVRAHGELLARLRRRAPAPDQRDARGAAQGGAREQGAGDDDVHLGDGDDHPGRDPLQGRPGRRRGVDPEPGARRRARRAGDDRGAAVPRRRRGAPQQHRHARRHQRAPARGVPLRRRPARARPGRVPGARGAQGAGGGRAHLRARQQGQAQQGRLRPARDHLRPGLRRVPGRAPALESGGGRDGRGGGHVRGAFIDALYSSTSGGFTADNEEAYNSAPVAYLRGMPDRELGRAPEHVPSLEVFRNHANPQSLRAMREGDFESDWARLHRWSYDVVGRGDAAGGERVRGHGRRPRARDRRHRAGAVGARAPHRVRHRGRDVRGHEGQDPRVAASS